MTHPGLSAFAQETSKPRLKGGSKKLPNLAFQRKVLLAVAVSWQKLAVQARYNQTGFHTCSQPFLTGR
jgi:hypothetical protein